jgi:hypothetical protein
MSDVELAREVAEMYRAGAELNGSMFYVELEQIVEPEVDPLPESPL